ncbi:MAG: class I SAM-dependent methyltransferase [bacterium]
MIQAPYETAFRLINGFLEGVPNVIVDVFGRTVVCHDYSRDKDEQAVQVLDELVHYVRENLPWVLSFIVKQRRSDSPEARNGRLVFGTKIDKYIKENGVLYALNLTMNRDSSFYLDTRYLREWIYTHLQGKSVLNTFAYTGSLGIAALMGGASEVVHLDLNAKFMAVAKRSAELNGKGIENSQYQIGDFWSRINQYKKRHKLFDCVILDPPVYSKTPKGTIDLSKNYHKLINKVRPIIHDGGYLVSINNALFQSGKTHHDDLQCLCKDGYLRIEKIIPVHQDCLGFLENFKEGLPADPAPYNYSTKMTILRIKRKD